MAFAYSVIEPNLQSIPMIDVGGLMRGGQNEITIIADQLGRAAQNSGFFRIYNHGIDPRLIEATYKIAERFFALSEHQKLRYYIGKSRNHRGYVPFSEKGDYDDETHRNYEAFDLGIDLPENDPDFVAGVLVLGPNIWPDLADFKETISQYYAEVSLLGRQLCSALEIYLGLCQGAITDHMTKPVSQLRLLHYVRNSVVPHPHSVNMGAHTDYECLTLLHTRNEGLQVMAQDDQWIDVPVDHSAYVVNIGDMLEAWSNGILRSTPHRVVNRSPERFSIPYFVAANHDTEIRPFPQLVKNGEHARYEPFVAGAHLERMLQRDFPYLRRRLKAEVKKADLHSRQIENPFEARIKGRTE